jgi:hypothetical protein
MDIMNIKNRVPKAKIVLFDGLLTLKKKSVLQIRDVYPGPKWSIPDTGPEFFHHGSRIRIFPSRTPDQIFSIPDPVSTRNRIPDSDFFSSLIRIQGSKRHWLPDPDPRK